MYHFTEGWYGKKRHYTSEECFTRKEMEQIYKEEIDKKSYKFFEDWMWEMRRADLVKQNFPSESELKEYAKDASKSIVISSCDEYGQTIYTRREATGEESEILYRVIYGALLGVRCHLDDDVEISTRELQACLASAEFIARQFLPNCNSYDSVYRVVNEFYGW